MAIRTTAVLLLIAALVASPRVLPARPAHACSCFSPELEVLTARAEFVLLGTVIRSDQIHDQDPSTLDDQYDLTIDANEYLKEAGPNRIHVQDPQRSTCSAFSGADPVGHQYLLFLTTDKEGHLGTSFCAGSGRVTDDEYWRERIEEVRQIVSENQQPGDTPAPAVTPTPQLPPAGTGTAASDGGGLLPATALIAVFAGLAGLGVASWRGIRNR